jgi:tetratricopeptide (TPR) repeat protein
MPDNMEYIDNYFKNTPTTEERSDFERRLAIDNEFAEDVALYLAAQQSIKEDINLGKKTRFKDLYQDKKVVKMPSPIRKLRPYIAIAAALFAVILGWYMFMQPKATPQQLCTKYAIEEFQRIELKMNAADEKAEAIELFNKANYASALTKFEKLLSLDTSSLELKQYVGATSFQLKHYDEALEYFKKMESHTKAFNNPAVFYQALTLMKRNLPGDEQAAKALLQKIVDNNLDKKAEAEEVLKKW